MAKALKVFVILLFLVSAGALTLGILTYQQKEVLKKRVQENENTLDQIAKNLQSTGFAKANLVVAKPEEFGKMAAEQKKLATDAAIRWEALKQTEKDLADTTDRLNTTSNELVATKGTLAERVAEVAQLKETVSQKEQQIAQLDGQINELKTAKADLESQVKDRDDKIARHEETIKDLKGEVASWKEDNKRLEAELSGCLYPDGRQAYMRPGTAARVVKVNDDWNFVVLNLGSNEGARPNAMMYVHRGEQLVGRVRLAVVNSGMSIAEIDRDWAQGQIQEGDFVVH